MEKLELLQEKIYNNKHQKKFWKHHIIILISNETFYFDRWNYI